MIVLDVLFSKSVNGRVYRMQQSAMTCWNQQTLQRRELPWPMTRSWRLAASHWQNSSQNLCILLQLLQRFV